MPNNSINPNEPFDKLIGCFKVGHGSSSIRIEDTRDVVKLAGKDNIMRTGYVHMSVPIFEDLCLCIEQLLIENENITLEQLSEWLKKYTYQGYNVFERPLRYYSLSS